MINKTCNCNNEKILKKAYFMLKSMLFNGDKKCICYMTTIEKALDMFNILGWLSKLLAIEIEYWQVDCNTSKTIRHKIIHTFTVTSKIAILINVHILDEGINIPSCDSVFITQPSNNMINIIQRMCRSNRITDNKSNCNIYLWCKEKKTDIILNYIFENTDGFIKDKVFIYNTNKQLIEKHNIKKSFGDNKLSNNIYHINLYFKDEEIKFIFDIDDVVWFKFSNIATILEYKDRNDVLKKHVDKKYRKHFKNIKTNHILDKQKPDTVYITESGLYKLLIRSRMKKTEQIHEWLIKEALPKLRNYDVKTKN
jgi:hypothetical protein